MSSQDSEGETMMARSTSSAEPQVDADGDLESMMVRSHRRPEEDYELKEKEQTSSDEEESSTLRSTWKMHEGVQEAQVHP